MGQTLALPLFAHREMPQAYTSFSPFELLYGRQVRGPLDVLRENRESSDSSRESIVSYVINIRQKMDRMTELVRENCAKPQKEQKWWYDKDTRTREFEKGDLVLVLLKQQATSPVGGALSNREESGEGELRC